MDIKIIVTGGEIHEFGLDDAWLKKFGTLPAHEHDKFTLTLEQAGRIGLQDRILDLLGATETPKPKRTRKAKE